MYFKISTLVGTTDKVLCSLYCISSQLLIQLKTAVCIVFLKIFFSSHPVETVVHHDCSSPRLKRIVVYTITSYEVKIQTETYL